MTEEKSEAVHPLRLRVVKGLSLVEDFVYLGIGILLALSAFALMGSAFKDFVSSVAQHALNAQFVGLLDQVLLMLLVVELLYTVQVSFREHGLVAEPFMVVALIAVIRKILVTTAATAHLQDATDTFFYRSMIELGALTVMVLVLVASLIALQRQTRLMKLDDSR